MREILLGIKFRDKGKGVDFHKNNRGLFFKDSEILGSSTLSSSNRWLLGRPSDYVGVSQDIRRDRFLKYYKIRFKGLI